MAGCCDRLAEALPLPPEPDLVELLEEPGILDRDPLLGLLSDLQGTAHDLRHLAVETGAAGARAVAACRRRAGGSRPPSPEENMTRRSTRLKSERVQEEDAAPSPRAARPRLKPERVQEETSSPASPGGPGRDGPDPEEEACRSAAGAGGERTA